MTAGLLLSAVWYLRNTSGLTSLFVWDSSRITIPGASSTFTFTWFVVWKTNSEGSLESDCMAMGFVVYMLFNVIGTNFSFWVCFLPVAMVVGEKLQHIITTLALESAMATNLRTAIKPRDELFWFLNPRLLLKLIHFDVFQNAFELATFLWTSGSSDSAHASWLTRRTILSTGSEYKHSIFQDNVKEKLNVWRKDAKKKANQHP
ncbi:hypothetical protein R1sor_007029 [Riccia sorocarpa]|uniref:Uncharacterized protein n=1 Tax=Riccia sorocarpa TaxID=122646 RepID=A0ABD3HP63_9MARC